jgi:hypothetical protein
MYRLVLGPTQIPVQCVLGILSLSMKDLGCEVDYSSLSYAKVENEWMVLYLHSPFMSSWPTQGQLNLLLSVVVFL